MAQRMPPSPARTRRPAQSEPGIRPGVTAIALGMLALAVGFAALSLLRSPADTTPPRPTAATSATQHEIATGGAAGSLGRTREARAESPPSARDWVTPREAKRAAAPLARPAATGPAEPQWDGKGLPSRDWLRWQLETLVAQAHPNGSISMGALDAAIDDALAVRAAKIEMEQAADPDALQAAHERYERATQDLASNLGIEGIDLSAF